MTPPPDQGRLGEILARHGVRLKRGLGQHLLRDAGAVRRIVAAAEIVPGERVLEIGPGAGALTRALCAAGAHVEAVELDRTWEGVLRETLAGCDVRLTWGDALTVPLPACDKLVSNLPYNVAGPLLARVLPLGLKLYVVALQREVAERLTAPPGGRAYGALTLLVAYHGRAEILFRLPPGAFLPPPRVHSAVVRIRPHPAPPVDCPREPLLALIRAAFAHRRKTIANALGVPAARIAAVGLDPRRRPETLTLSEFAALLRAGVYSP